MPEMSSYYYLWLSNNASMDQAYLLFTLFGCLFGIGMTMDKEYPRLRWAQLALGLSALVSLTIAAGGH